MEQVIVGGNMTQGTTATRYNLLYGTQSAWNTNIDIIEQLIAAAGKIKNLRVKLSVAPGAGTSWTYTLMINGAATALTCTIADTATTGSDTTHEVTVSPGDYVCMRVVATGAPAIPRSRYSVIFEGDTAKESLLPGGLGTASKTETRYNVVAGLATWDAAPGYGTKQCIPTPGAIKNLYIKLSVGPGVAPDAYRFTLEVNGVASALTCTITGAATTGSDTTHSVDVSAGDIVRLMCEPLNTPANTPNVSWGMCFVADTDNESLLLGASVNPDIVATEYEYVVSTPIIATGTESDIWVPAQECTAKKLYLELASAPGAGTSRVWTLRNNAADTALTVTIADTDTTGNDTTNEVDLADDDDINIEVTPVSGPNAPLWVAWGIVLVVLGAPRPGFGGNPSDVLVKNALI